MLQTVVLAAGKGVRIASIANGIPKPLLPIDGEPVLFRNLRWLTKSEYIDPIWINLHYQSDLLRREITRFAKALNNFNVNFSYEKSILGTAGGVKNIASQCQSDSHYLVIYGDNLYRFDLTHLIHTHFSQGNMATIALFDEKVNVHTGIAGGKVRLDNQARITDFIEGKAVSSFHYVNSGVYLLSPEIISRIPSNQFCDFGRDVFPRLLLDHVVLTGYVIDGYCLGLDTPDCLETAKKLIDQKKIELV